MGNSLMGSHGCRCCLCNNCTSLSKFSARQKTVYFASGTSSPEPSSVEETSDPCDFEEDPALDLGDLTLDEEEFPAELDPEQVVSFVEEAVEELSFC
jgi:hypothetical protein